MGLINRGNKEKTSVVWLFVVVFIGISINFICGYIASSTGIMLFLDTIGTMIAAAFGGFLPGIIVGLFSNVIKSFFDDASVYYGFINVLIATYMAYFAKKVWYKKPVQILLSVIGMGIIGGALSSVLTIFLYGFASEGISADLAKGFRDDFSFGIWGAQLAADIIIDVADKAVSFIPALLLANLIPEKIKNKVNYKGWRQKPLTKEVKESLDKIRSRVIPLRTKLLILIIPSLLAVAVACITISLMLYKNDSVEEQKVLATGVASMAGKMIDPEKVDEYIDKGKASAGYNEAEEKLIALRESAPKIEYVYIYKIMEDGCHAVIDPHTDEDDGNPPGTVIPFEADFQKYIPDLLAGKEIEPVISDGAYGWLLTVYSPVYDKNGNCVCYACADINMNEIRNNMYSFLAKLIALFLGIFVLILAVSIWLSEYHIILPINTMAMSASNFVYDSEEDVEDSVERIRRLGIYTGDEIEHLYTAFVKMTEDNLEFALDLQRKTETIANMQSGLIMTLADIVESRDKCTGDHVRKTAEYARLIMRQMQKLGIYTDQLTDKFIYDVGNSAPLHDVGKIHVPDQILNKPGRLDDDEFKIMKEHTTVGAQIIDRAIELVPDTGYLTEARNLALYHHEKWDGTGYPTGLKGEEIPLSARIMAIADVFDALVSKRSYKEGMPFDKAMDIIKEGAGKHFDANLVKAFVLAEDEARQISERFNSSVIIDITRGQTD